MYRMDIALSSILLISEMQEIPSVRAEAYFLTKLAFVTNRCLTQDAFGKHLRTTENFSKYTAVRE